MMEEKTRVKETVEVGCNISCDVYSSKKKTIGSTRTFFFLFRSIIGPLTYNDEGHETVVGVVSWGEGCADKRYPGVYARVTEALPWIEEQLTKTC